MKTGSLLFLIALALGCAHPAQQRRVEITEPTVITAGPPGDLALGEMDEATLFDVGTRAFQGGEFEKARQHFDRLWSSFPASADLAPALWNAGLACERLGRFAEALERFERYARLKDEPEAQFHAAIAEYKLGRLDEAAHRLQRLSARPGLPVLRRADALLQEGVCRIEAGARSEGERLVRAALDIYQHTNDERVDPALPAQAEFWLGESYRGAFRQQKLDPASMDEKGLSDALEAKAQLLLSAQGYYLRCIRRGDGEWATAAGYRIGELYEELHGELLGAPLPSGLTEEQRLLYQAELRKKVKNLVAKAIRIYQENLSAAQRVGAQNAYVEKTGQALERLRKLLLESP